MSTKHRVKAGRAVALGALAGLACASTAMAQTKSIGGAETIQSSVSGTVLGRTRTLSSGDDVFANELIRTQAASNARLAFVDDTRLSIGPTSQVKLDRFVFNPDSTAKVATVNAMRGAFRWVSGASDHRAYQIRTPLATIGVRGTVFDLLVMGERTIVVLQEGVVIVCANGTRRCASLNNPGDVVTVTPGRVDGPRPGGPGASEFAGRCLGARTLSNCVVTAAADLPPDDFDGPPPRRVDVAPIVEFGLGMGGFGRPGGHWGGWRQGGDYGGSRGGMDGGKMGGQRLR